MRSAHKVFTKNWVLSLSISPENIVECSSLVTLTENWIVYQMLIRLQVRSSILVNTGNFFLNVWLIFFSNLGIIQVSKENSSSQGRPYIRAFYNHISSGNYFLKAVGISEHKEESKGDHCFGCSF